MFITHSIIPYGRMLYYAFCNTVISYSLLRILLYRLFLCFITFFAITYSLMLYYVFCNTVFSDSLLNILSYFGVLFAIAYSVLRNAFPLFLCVLWYHNPLFVITYFLYIALLYFFYYVCTYSDKCIPYYAFCIIVYCYTGDARHSYHAGRNSTISADIWKFMWFFIRIQLTFNVQQKYVCNHT